jgi:chemotaxis protein methyltransferase CheR
MNSNLTYNELTKVSEVIAKEMGIHFPIEKWEMLGRGIALAANAFAFNDISEFVNWLSTTKLEKNQIETLAAYLTISETYFWRESQVFEALSQNLIPEIIDSKHNDKRINIWCSACSTGEEAYSIAILLHRTIPEIKNWNITILATDINTNALDKAKNGKYNLWSFRNAPAWLQNNYFKKLKNDEYEVIPEIREMVSFSSFNLTHDNFSTSICNNQKMDIIFCRNVLMYFTSEWSAKIPQNFFNSLSDNGWLIVSSCELSSVMFPQYVPINYPGAVLYRKESKAFLASNKIAYCSQKQQLDIYKPSFVNDNNILKQIPETNRNHTNNIPEKNKAVTIVPKVLQEYNNVKTQEDFFNENKETIKLLANEGKLNEALLNCNLAIESDKLAPDLYYLKASILQELDNSLEAIKVLKQAVYIDPDYIMGHFTLGNLLIRHGFIKNARRHFENALELLNTIPTMNNPDESEGLSANYIRRIILNNLQTQKAQ